MGSAMRAGPRDRGGVAMCAEELDFVGDLVWTGPRGRVAPCGWGTLCAVPYGYDWAPWTGPYVVYFAFYEIVNLLQQLCGNLWNSLILIIYKLL